MSAADFSRLRVLVVDDDPFMLDLFKLTLQQLQVGDIWLAASGGEAIALLQQPGEQFDVLLCDLHMPGMDGIELLRHLGQLQYKQGLILISGADESILRAAVSLARAYFLNVLGSAQKPISVGTLRYFLSQYELAPGRRRPRHDSTLLTAAEFRRSLLNGDLVLAYQPQINMSSGEVVGMEALARLQHPQYGLLSPRTFIPVMEQGESLELFTEVVICRALEQTHLWRCRGETFKVSINVSAGALTRLDLPEILAGHCRRLQLDPQGITIEVTETQLDDDPTASLEVLTRLRLRGLGLSIDDFGTGYASLERLNRAPFDELKIDGSFVHGAIRDDAARAIFESSVALGKQLSLRVLVEGVEDPEDWALAARLGCEVAQGYLIARPMFAAAMDRWLKGWKGLSSLDLLADQL